MVEDIKKSYLGDSKATQILENLQSDTNQDPRLTHEGGVIRFKHKIYVGESNNMR